MNFYNPYFYTMPAMRATPSLLSRFNLSSLLSGANKTLNFINQTIPIARQVSPIMKNAKTMFQIMNEFKKNDVTVNNEVVQTDINKDYVNTNTGNNNTTIETNYQNGPQFFI